MAVYYSCSLIVDKASITTENFYRSTVSHQDTVGWRPLAKRWPSGISINMNPQKIVFNRLQPELEYIVIVELGDNTIDMRQVSFGEKGIQHGFRIPTSKIRIDKLSTELVFDTSLRSPKSQIKLTHSTNPIYGREIALPKGKLPISNIPLTINFAHNINLQRNKVSFTELNPVIIYGTTVGLSEHIAEFLQTLDEIASNLGPTLKENSFKLKYISPEILIGTEVELQVNPCKISFGTNAGTEVIYGFKVNSPLMQILMSDSLLSVTDISSPSLTKYIQATQRSSQQIIFGTDSDVFKLNKAALTTKKRNPVNLIHLGKVKPSVNTVQANFKLETFCAHLDAGEWVYRTPDGYLFITNTNEVSLCLIQIGDTPEIPIDPQTGDFQIGITW